MRPHELRAEIATLFALFVLGGCYLNHGGERVFS
jgi:hypothetical protein